MQTIFRVQTPATINGKVKEECFVFDFAPDRTLKVIAETAKMSAKAGKTSGKDRDIMGEFLNFCPIIAFDGSQMKPYDVKGMLEQLKKVYVERVVRNGFEDSYLYNNDQLMKLGTHELEEFEGLKKIIGSTKAMPKSGDIDVNKQGFTDEEYEKQEKAKKKQASELTEAEKQLLAKRLEQKKTRDNAVSILRGISIRMPLLIYGADVKNEETEISIDTFADLVDNQSWEEFMPKGVTKATFRKFKKYYEPDVFSAAGKRIRALARAADNETVEERIERITAIFATFRNPDKETVLTPWRVVNMHLGDCLGGYVFLDETREKTIAQPQYMGHGNVTENVFSPESRILEINSKSGLYPLFVAYSIYRQRLKQQYPNQSHETLTVIQQQALWDKTVADNVFVICKTPMAKSITKRTLVGFRNAPVNARYFEDLIKQIANKPDSFVAKVKKGKSYWNTNNNDNMKFNAIVGNPPYQETKEGTSDNPIYHLFMDIAFKISDKVTFITPARFLFNAGKTPKEWNTKILNDKHFKVIWYESNSSKIFPNVDIKGGVAVTLRDKSQEFEKIGSFSSYTEIGNILEKVTNENFQPLSDWVFAPESYRISKKLHSDFPDAEAKLSKGHLYDLTTNIFEKLGDIFFDVKPTDENEYIQIIGRLENTRVLKWIKREYIDPHINLGFYKVVLPKSNGKGELGETLSSPLIGYPSLGHNQTFISIGTLETENEANNLLIYVKSKFLRLLLGSLKVTQDNKKDVWKNIPLQDFTTNSDLDWGQSIAEIDQQLYKKYGLSEAEVAFIERMIKPMEG
jgi:Eco57I restriction-modification methylase